VTCIVIFEAHKPHNKNRSSWFGYFKYDGFEKIRNKGRVDFKNIFKNEIKNKWLNAYFNKTESIGFSILKNISEKDEWLVESYMKTDYNKLKKHIFEKTIKKYITYLFYNDLSEKISTKRESNIPIELNIENWKVFKIEDIFNVKGSKTTPKRRLQEIGEGYFPYITTSSVNNGVEKFYNHSTEEGNVLVIDSAVKGFCSYQKRKFSASDHVEKLIPKFEMNPYIAMFIVTIINLEQYRYSYGRKFNQTRIKKTEILLPVNDGKSPDYYAMENFVKSLKYSNSIVSSK
jgi:hypothetical protein